GSLELLEQVQELRDGTPRPQEVVSVSVIPLAPVPHPPMELQVQRDDQRAEVGLRPPGPRRAGVRCASACAPPRSIHRHAPSTAATRGFPIGHPPLSRQQEPHPPLPQPPRTRPATAGRPVRPPTRPCPRTAPS